MGSGQGYHEAARDAAVEGREPGVMPRRRAKRGRSSFHGRSPSGAKCVADIQSDRRLRYPRIPTKRRSPHHALPDPMQFVFSLRMIDMI